MNKTFAKNIQIYFNTYNKIFATIVIQYIYSHNLYIINCSLYCIPNKFIQNCVTPGDMDILYIKLNIYYNNRKGRISGVTSIAFS